MKIYCCSDIHGCLAEFEEALALFQEKLEEPDTMLILLGDYVHGGGESRGVLDKIMELRVRYGSDKVIAILGNHDEWVIDGSADLDYMDFIRFGKSDDGDDKYINFLASLPRYHTEENLIFTHAGIDEESGDLWEWSTDDYTYNSKYPADTGKIEGFDGKVIAGHVYTSEIAGDPLFHDIYLDESHIYIDGDVLTSGIIPVLLIDMDEEERYRYYRVTEAGVYRLLPYVSEITDYPDHNEI